MRKVIKIFLASSIVEFEYERMAIENFIRNISDKFEENYDVKIQPLLCENFDDAFSRTRKQEEYNEKIRTSDLCFFVFFTKAGEYTREEFDVARKMFEETGKPKIYTYFKIIKDEKVEQSLYDFMSKLEKTFGHYYGTFDHVDTIKLRILLSLKLQEMDFVEIKTENGKCVVDGKSIMSLNNVSEFVNNKELEVLQEELKKVEKEYFQLRATYKKGNCDNVFYKHYYNIASKRQKLINEIDEIQSMIFNMSLRMSYDEVHGEITPKQKEAYRLFERGDYEGSMAVLDSKDIDDEFSKAREKIKEQNIAVCKRYIKEHKTAIDILKVMKNYKERFVEINQRYEKIIPIILSEEIEFDIVCDYALYLSEQNREIDAINIAECLLKIKAKNKISIDKHVLWLYGFLRQRYSHQNQIRKAKKYFVREIKIWEALTRENPKKFSHHLAHSYDALGIFLCNQGEVQRAEKYYNKAIAIWEREKTGKFYIDLAISYNHLGVFYYEQGEVKKAERLMVKSIEIAEAFVKDNSERVNTMLADGYATVGILYYGQGDVQKTELYMGKAIEIMEVLASENPKKYNSRLSRYCNNMGFFYYTQGEVKTAEKLVGKAIEIMEVLASENPKRFDPELASIYNNAVSLYEEQGDIQKAELYLVKSMEMSEIFASGNLERYNPNLVKIYNNAASFYYNQGDVQKAELYLVKSMEKVEVLASENPKRFNPELASIYNNAVSLYEEQGDVQKAELYLVKSMEIMEVLASENPE